MLNKTRCFPEKTWGDHLQTEAFDSALTEKTIRAKNSILGKPNSAMSKTSSGTGEFLPEDCDHCEAKQWILNWWSFLVGNKLNCN